MSLLLIPSHPPTPPGASKKKFKCLILYITYVRFRLMGAPGITHEPCSYPAVLSSAYIPFFAFRTSTALSQRPSVQ